MKKPLSALSVLGAILLSGCAVSSNFYSGRTLEERKFAFGFGLDDLAIKSTEQSLTVTKKVPFVPSIVGAYGLPWRFELGARYYLPNLLGVSLRHQVNPRSFDMADLSLNLQYDGCFGRYSDLRYGLTLSKNINEFEPYVHYTGYHFLSFSPDAFDGRFISGVVATFVNGNRCIGVGIGLPIKKAKIYPEVNYQYFGGDVRHGLLHVGVGLRVFPN
jgi:hypothetical protein